MLLMQSFGSKMKLDSHTASFRNTVFLGVPYSRLQQTIEGRELQPTDFLVALQYKIIGSESTLLGAAA